MKKCQIIQGYSANNENNDVNVIKKKDENEEDDDEGATKRCGTIR